MSDSAHVTSIAAISRFAAALRTFQDQATGALLLIDEQAGRALQWIEHDAAMYWRNQVRIGFEEVARTRTELETCRMRTYAGMRPSCIDEIKAHRAAQIRLRHAEEMIDVVRKWTQRLRRELDEYRGRIASLRRCLDGDVPRTAALLERTVSSLDAYVDRVPGASDGASSDAQRDVEQAHAEETT